MKMPSQGGAGQFVDELLGHGRYTFTREEATTNLKRSSAATYMALHRLEKAGRLLMPRSGFYVIVDPQHRINRTLPPEWFINDLMLDISRPYYLGLLSSVQVHETGKYHPGELQVIIPTRTIRPVFAGNVQINFYGKGCFDHSQTTEIKTHLGILKTSAPETTAWDLVRYFKAVGGLKKATSLLSNLAPTLDAKRLRSTVVKHGEAVVAQRLGYLLDQLGYSNLTERIVPWIKNAPKRLLDPRISAMNAPESQKWQLVINSHMGLKS